MLLVALVAFLFFTIVLVAKAIRIIEQSEEMIIQRFGRYYETLKPGLHFIFPIIDSPKLIAWKVTYDSGPHAYYAIRMVDRIDMRENVYDFPSQSVITRDNVTVQINALLYFQVVDSKAASYEISSLPLAIEKLTQTSLRNVIGELTLDETLSSRDTINAKLRVILDEASNKWGVEVNRVELQDITPPPAMREAMENQKKAEQEKRAMILEAEGQKRAQILQAEGMKEAAINKAEGEKRARILEAEGIAEAKMRVAEGETNAIRIVADNVKNYSNPANYLISLKYIEALQQITDGKNNKLVFMPYEASGILGAVGAVKELVDSKKQGN